MRFIRNASALCLFALISAFPGLVLGSETPLSAEMAVERALANSPDLSADIEEIKGLHEAADKMALLSNPVLELEAGTGAFTNSPDEQRASIAIFQEIPLSATGSRRRAVARAEAQAAQLRLEYRRLQLTDQVRRAWSGAALAAQLLERGRSQTVIAETLHAIARERFDAGDLPEFEVQLAAMERTRQLLYQTELEAELLASRRQLALLMGLAGEQELPDLAPVTVPQPISLTDEQLLALVQKRRPDLLAQNKETERDQAALELAKAEAIPGLTVGISYSHERSSQNSYDLNGGALVISRERTADRTLGLKLSLPIPFFNRNQTEIAKARGRVGANQHRMTSTLLTMTTELRDLLTRHRLALTALELHRTALGPVARENLKIQETAFKLGEIGIQAVLDEKRRLAQQEEAELKALQMAIETYSRLEAATGGAL